MNRAADRPSPVGVPAVRGPARMPDIADPVHAQRDGDTLRIRFNRPQRHNAFSTDARAALLEALTVAQLDPSVTGIVLSGNGPSFCSGGDLAEFGTFTDPASAHLARTRHSPALALDALTARLGRAWRAEVHRPERRGDSRVGRGEVDGVHRAHHRIWALAASKRSRREVHHLADPFGGAYRAAFELRNHLLDRTAGRCLNNDEIDHHDRK